MSIVGISKEYAIVDCYRCVGTGTMKTPHPVFEKPFKEDKCVICNGLGIVGVRVSDIRVANTETGFLPEGTEITLHSRGAQ